MPKPRKLTRAALFERVVHRIHELLERDTKAKVTWDDRVTDPDTPKRKRQVDITVKRDGLLTLIECRLHQEAQDVTWIEELIGRRASMGANSVIGVSSSGFTSTARTKAARFGIHLREVADLTDAEVQEWGSGIKLEIGYHRFERLEVALVLTDEKAPSDFQINVDEAREVLWPLYQTLLNTAVERLPDLLLKENRNKTASFHIAIRPVDEVRLQGRPVMAATIKGQARLEMRPITSPALKRYGNPLTKEDKLARVQMFALGETSAIFDGTAVSLVIDLSTLGLPPLSQVRYVTTANATPMSVESFELIGAAAGLQASPGRIKLRTLVGPTSAMKKMAASIAPPRASKGYGA